MKYILLIIFIIISLNGYSQESKVFKNVWAKGYILVDDTIKCDSLFLEGYGWVSAAKLAQKLNTSDTIYLPQARTAGSLGIGFLKYNGTTKVNGQLYGATTNPSGSTRCNYDGDLYATQLWARDFQSFGTSFRIGMQGGFYWYVTSTTFGGGSGASALTRNAPGNTTPSLLTNSNNTTTGIGGSGTNISFIQSGVEKMRINDTCQFFGDIKTNGIILNSQDTTITAVEGMFVWKVSDHAPYVCVSTTASKKWYKLKLE